MAKKSKEEIIDVEVDDGIDVVDDEVVEMSPDSKGTFHAVAISKINHQPQWQPPMCTLRSAPLNIRRQSAIVQMIDGFIVGLDAVERFLDRMDGMKKKGRR